MGGLKTKPDTPLPKDKPNQQQKLNGGVMITDIKVGDGALAKPGKTVIIIYLITLIFYNFIIYMFIIG